MWDLATYFVGPKKMRDASPKAKAKGSTKAKQKSLSQKTTKISNKANNKPVKGKNNSEKVRVDKTCHICSDFSAE